MKWSKSINMVVDKQTPAAAYLSSIDPCTVLGQRPYMASKSSHLCALWCSELTYKIAEVIEHMNMSAFVKERK